MQNLEIKKALQNYGLSIQETEVYLAVLSLANATVKEIALFTNIKRTTIYLIAERLIVKGIMGEYKAKYGTHYTVQSPKNLLTKLEDAKTEIETIMPQLETLAHRESYEPNIKSYRGKNGYLTILSDSLEGFSHEILYIGSAEDLNTTIGERYVVNKYIPTRLKKKINFKQIVLADEFSKKLQKNDTKSLRQTKFLPKEYTLNANMIIYKDKVAYLTSKRELIGVLIESKDIADMERKKFELLWEKL